MAKMVDGPFVAVAVELPTDAPMWCEPGTSGILEIWESERKWPGKKGAWFFYLEKDGETLGYFRTTYSYDLSLVEGVASFEKDGRCYRFRIGGASEVR
jgi:hypothetical protein